MQRHVNDIDRHASASRYFRRSPDSGKLLARGLRNNQTCRAPRIVGISWRAEGGAVVGGSIVHVGLPPIPLAVVEMATDEVVIAAGGTAASSPERSDCSWTTQSSTLKMHAKLDRA
jgi:hypothetical protein